MAKQTKAAVEPMAEHINPEIGNGPDQQDITQHQEEGPSIEELEAKQEQEDLDAAQDAAAKKAADEELFSKSADPAVNAAEAAINDTDQAPEDENLDAAEATPVVPPARKRGRPAGSKNKPKTDAPAPVQAPDAATIAASPVVPNSPKKLSGIAACAKVLAESGKSSMKVGEMVDAAIAQGLWSPGGLTPAATVYSAILRDMKVHGDKALFTRAVGGGFMLNK